MNWDALGAVAELLGAVAVLITLIYLALQIKQNRQSVQSSAAQAILASVNNAIQNAASSPELSGLLVRGQGNIESLSEAERGQFALWFLSYFRIMDQAYHHYLEGHFNNSIWEAYSRHTQSIVKSRGIQQWWTLRKAVFSIEFQQYIENLAQQETSIAVSDKLVAALGSQTADEAAAEQ